MSVDEWMVEWNSNDGASDDVIRRAASFVDKSLPDDYLNFLKKSNGGEGFIGRNYLILWKAEELNAFNLEYEVQRYAPGLLAFGSSGGGECYAFDSRDERMPVVRVPFVGMGIRFVQEVASCFTDFLRKLAEDSQ